jgi:formiminotetrahydrofolate cyclodeaminase
MLGNLSQPEHYYNLLYFQSQKPSHIVIHTKNHGHANKISDTVSAVTISASPQETLYLSVINIFLKTLERTKNFRKVLENLDNKASQESISFL